MENELLTGRVLWWSERDGYGIVVDSKDNEYYTDISAIPNRIHLVRNQSVRFKINLNIKDCLCAIVTSVDKLGTK